VLTALSKLVKRHFRPAETSSSLKTGRGGVLVLGVSS
jgi:hypothetical protein